MAREITDYRYLDISNLRRWGYLTPAQDTAFKSGVVSWERDGETIAQICISVRLCDYEQAVGVSYLYGGKPKQYKIELQFVPSNLPGKAETGYYYFVCPVSGVWCRKLYLVGGQFMSRRAFRPLYVQQTMSHKTRGLYSIIDTWKKIEEIEAGSRWRKNHYRGKPTPYCKKLSKYYRMV